MIRIVGRKVFFLAVLISLAAVACKKEDIEPVVVHNGGAGGKDSIIPPAFTCYLEVMEQAYMSAGKETKYTLRYTYNDKDQLTSCKRYDEMGKFMEEYRYAYSGNKITTYEYWDKEGLAWYSEFRYNNGEQPSDEFSYMQGGGGHEQLGHTHYDYDDKGRIKQAWLYDDTLATSGECNQYATYVYDNAGNNIKRSFYNKNNMLIEAYEYEFDAVKNAYFNENMPGIFSQYTNTNNIKRFVYLKNGYKIERYTASYQKNGKGYPTQGNYTYSDGSSVEQKYTYRCE